MLSSCGNSATGEDKISYTMIRKSHPKSQKFLLAIMNKIFNTGQYPSQWLSGIVLSFQKPGKPPTTEENHRPISLTSCVGKLMEKIINSRLTSILEGNKHIPPHQFGFRKMHSTIDALNRFTTDILDALNRRESILCVSFDMRKAYDTTWRFGILKALFDFGIRGKLPTIIRSFLTNRTFKTKIGTTYSRYHTLEQGVPQGGVLSCTLFSLAINGILGCIPENIKASLYVDDLLIYCSGNYIPGLERRLQGAINKISTWADSHGFTFSTPKTNCIHFHRKRSFQTPLKLMLNNAIIPNRESIKYLGMTLDCKMTWKEHIRSLKLECTKRLDLLKCLTHTTWGSDRVTMLRLYRAIIRSKLDYGCFVYGSAKDSILNTLDPVHNSAIRLCTGAYRTSPVASLYAESAEPALSTRREQLLLQYYARTMQLPSSAAYSYVQPNENIYGNTRRISPTIADLIVKTTSDLELNIRTLPVARRIIPTWKLDPDTVCKNHEYPKKDNCSDNTFRCLFREHVTQHHSNQYQIFSDGSKNEQGVGCSATSFGGSRKMRLMMESSIFTAEICGLICGLQIAQNVNRTDFVIFCDSRGALRVVEHYNSTHPLIAKMIRWIIRLRNVGKKINFCWCPAHVGIPGNEAADKMAVEAARSNTPAANEETPYRDWYPVIRTRLRTRWSEEWRLTGMNKLRTIKNSVDDWSSSNQKNRKHSIILTRLRIGHTKATHQYLIEKTPQPYCEDCIVPLTVKHFIAECPSFLQLRQQNIPHGCRQNYG